MQFRAAPSSCQGWGKAVVVICPGALPQTTNSDHRGTQAEFSRGQHSLTRARGKFSASPGWGASPFGELPRPVRSCARRGGALPFHQSRELVAELVPAVANPQPTVRWKFGPSSVVPFRVGERPADRHRRRYEAAAANRAVVEAWCADRGLALRYGRDNGYEFWKWKIAVPDGFAQWFPWVGKLAMKRPLRGGEYQVVKCYDHVQLMQAIDEVLLAPWSSGRAPVF